MDKGNLLIRYHQFLIDTGRIIQPEEKTLTDTLKEFYLTTGFITVREFINMCQGEMSVRLYNVMLNAFYDNGDKVFINDLNSNELKRYRNFGSKCLAEYLDLRLKYLNF